MSEQAQAVESGEGVGAADAYEPGRTYELWTFADMVETFRKLPEERGAVLLRELGDAVRYMAAYANLMGAVAGAAVEVTPFWWIDDDKGHADINAHFADGEVLTLEVRPSEAPEPRP